MIILSYAAYGITSYGYTNLFLQISKREDARVDYLFEGFRGFKRMIKQCGLCLRFCYIQVHGFRC